MFKVLFQSFCKHEIFIKLNRSSKIEITPKVEYTTEEFNWICTIIDGRKFEGNGSLPGWKFCPKKEIGRKPCIPKVEALLNLPILLVLVRQQKNS